VLEAFEYEVFLVPYPIFHENGMTSLLQYLVWCIFRIFCIICWKAKESYHARCVEYEKMKRENASSKDLDKVEAKYKKASEFGNFCM